MYDSASDEDRNFVLKVIRPVFAENNYEVFIKDIDTIGGSCKYFYSKDKCLYVNGVIGEVIGSVRSGHAGQ